MIITYSKPRHIFSIVLILKALSIDSYAENNPTSGKLYNKKDRSFIEYNCSSQGVYKIKCDFEQFHLAQKLDESDLETDAEVLRQFRNGGSIEFAKLCLSAKAMFPDIYKNTASGMTKGASAIEKRDLQNQLIIFEQFCNNQTEDNFMKIKRNKDRILLNTCVMRRNSFHQEFSKSGKDGDTWISNSIYPPGVCGVVDLSKFVLDKSSSSNSWNFISKKTVLNPDKLYGTGTHKCGYILDQSEQIYDWKPTAFQIQCNYFEF